MHKLAYLMILVAGLAISPAVAQTSNANLPSASTANGRMLLCPVAGAAGSSQLCTPAQVITEAAKTPITWSAAQNFGKTYSGNINSANVSTHWLEVSRPHSVTIAQQSAISPNGGIGILGASRTSDSGAGNAGGQASIGVSGYAINDNPVAVQTTYAGYFDAKRLSSAVGTTQGIEVDVGNLGNLVPLTPVGAFSDGMTPGIWDACGGGYTGALPCTAAFTILDNGAQWNAGIVMVNSAFTTQADGKKSAMLLPYNGAIRWYDFVGNNTGNIFSDGAGTSGMNLHFAGPQVWFENLTGAPTMTFSAGGATANQPLYIANNLAAAYPATGSWGVLGWNKSAGGGEFDEFNGFTTATLSFARYQMTGTGAATKIDGITPAGLYQPAQGVQLPPVGYSSLPACNTGNQGTMAYIVDASAPITAWHQAVIGGGGSNTAFITCNGTGWYAFSY